MEHQLETRLTSAFISLMLTSSLLPGTLTSAIKTAGPSQIPGYNHSALGVINKSGWVVGQLTLPEVSIPSPNIAPDNSPIAQLSAEQLAKLIKKTSIGLKSHNLSQRMAILLGLITTDQTIAFKYIPSTSYGDAYKFGVPIDEKLDLLFFFIDDKFQNDDRIRWLVTDRAGNLLPKNAGASVSRTSAPFLLTQADAKELYRSVSAIWTNEADKL